MTMLGGGRALTIKTASKLLFSFYNDAINKLPEKVVKSSDGTFYTNSLRRMACSGKIIKPQKEYLSKDEFYDWAYFNGIFDELEEINPTDPMEELTKWHFMQLIMLPILVYFDENREEWQQEDLLAFAVKNDIMNGLGVKNINEWFGKGEDKISLRDAMIIQINAKKFVSKYI